MRRLIAFLSTISFLAAMAACTPEENNNGEVRNNPKELTVTGNATVLGFSSVKITAFANLPIELGDAVCGVVCSTSSSPSNENGIIVEATGIDANNMFSVTIDGLSSDTKYYYTSFVRNGRVYQYGEVKSFKTQEVKADIKTEPATDVAIFKATLNGSLKVESKEESDLDVWFMYGADNTVEGLKTNGTRTSASLNNDGSFSSSMVALRGNTAYYYIAYARVYDKEFVGEVKAFTTKRYTAVAGEAVDLGLSVKWSSMNLGATSPTDYGDYFAWGETAPKGDYRWTTYGLCNGSSESLTKYNTRSSFGTVDNKTNFKDYDYEDDAARQALGGKWRIPTDAEWTELLDNCTWTWATQNGVYGKVVKSKTNGNSIFLPAAGEWSALLSDDDSKLFSVGSDGYYWSSSLNAGSPFGAWFILFSSDFNNVYRSYSDRSNGQSVRPVTE